MRRSPRTPWSLGDRTLLAATCYGCGKLCPGNSFRRHVRNNRDGQAYIDRRCPNCKWQAKLKGRREEEWLA